MARAELVGYQCASCGHEWVPRNTSTPRPCPACRNSHNDQPPKTMRLQGYRCERCGHKWVPRNTSTPRICPACKSAYYDRPRHRPTPLTDTT